MVEDHIPLVHVYILHSVTEWSTSFLLEPILAVHRVSSYNAKSYLRPSSFALHLHICGHVQCPLTKVL